MFHLLRVDVCLGPFEGCRILVPTCHKSFDCFDQHADASEVSALQGATAQDAKPAFKLIEPAAVGGNKVKMHIGMGFEPAVLFRLMGVKIVQNHVQPFGPYAVRPSNFASNAKASLSPQSKGGSPEQVGSYHLLLALLRYHLQGNTSPISSARIPPSPFRLKNRSHETPSFWYGRRMPSSEPSCSSSNGTNCSCDRVQFPHSAFRWIVAPRNSSKTESR